MIIDIPGYKKLQITTLLLDYNGTIAEDGIIRPAVKERLQKLSKELSIYVLTADTHGCLMKSVERCVHVWEMDAMMCACSKMRHCLSGL